MTNTSKSDLLPSASDLMLIFDSWDSQVVEEAQEFAPEKRLGTTFRALGDA